MTDHSTQDATWEDDAVYLGRDDVSDFNPENILPLPDKKLADVRAWLQPTAYEHEDSEFHRHLASHLGGTGEWLLKTREYLGWHDGQENGLLWIRGIPGSGKSVYAATLIQHLRKEQVPVLFFFFRQIIDANHQPVSALHDWLAQILPFSPPLQMRLAEYIADHRTLESLSPIDLWENLRSALRQIPKAFVVVDALDEMDRGDEMQSFLEHLSEFARWRPANTKVLMTSRPVAYIESALRKSNAVNIRLQETLVDSDIATFIAHRLATSTINAQDQALIRTAVPGHANGLFLYAKLAMDAFLQPAADISKVLDTLPRDLNLMYNDLLTQHAQRSGLPENIQLIIMQFVTHATRPLRLREIASMINTTQYPPEKRNLDAMKQLVRVACGPLLEILPDETVSVIHHSFTEFLCGVTRDVADGGYPVLAPGKTHLALAEICLKYLDSEILENADLKMQSGKRENTIYAVLEKNTFARYAGKNWFIHARKAAMAGADQTGLNSFLDSIFNSEKLANTMIMSGRGSIYNRSGHPGDHTVQVTQVYAATVLGLNDYLNVVLSRPGMEINRGINPTESPLCYASSQGYADIVSTLLKAGADTGERDVQQFQGYAPLHHAVRNNHARVVKLLLEAGADLNRTTNFNDPSSIGHRDPSAFEMACRYGHIAVLEIFMPYVQSKELVCKALHWISQGDRADMLAPVLAHPMADVNWKLHNRTALFIATYDHNLPMVQELLQAGADAAILNDLETYCLPCAPGKGYNALHAWASCGFGLNGSFSSFYLNYKKSEFDSTSEIFKLLVGAGAAVNQVDRYDRTPLYYAQNAAMAELLVSEGADINVRDQDEKTPLEFSNATGVVQFLLKITKSTTSTFQMGDALLDCLEKGGWGLFKRNPLERAHLLLTHGADPTVVNSEGQTALHLLLQHGRNDEQVDDIRVSILKVLLKSELDINSRDNEGRSPLHLVNFDPGQERNDSQLLKLMLDAGADIEAKDGLGKTPLFLNLDSRHKFKDYGDEIIEACGRMLRHGARLDARDSCGRTLLHAVVNKCDAKTIDWLIEHGIDPHVDDDDGNNLFHELMKNPNNDAYDRRCSIEKLDRLISLNVDPRRANNAGRTPLHIASAGNTDEFTFKVSSGTENTNVFDWILAKHQEIDVADRDGITALHLASTFSEYKVKRLLELGADPLKPTGEGLNAFHLAARARQENILGMMTEALVSRIEEDQGSLYPPGETASHPRSPLFYACMSGRPESVKILLAGGFGKKMANYDNSPLQGATLFEEELRNWPKPTEYPIFDRYAHHSEQSAGSVTLQDTFRKAKSSDAAHAERINEILDMLVDHQLITEGHITKALEEATAKKAAYTLECLLRIQVQLGVERQHAGAEQMTALLQTRQNSRQSLEDKIASGDLFDVYDFQDAMNARFFELVIAKSSVESSLQPMRDPAGPNSTVFCYLVARGHASILRAIASPASIKTHDSGKWTTRDYGHDPYDLEPLLTTACRRATPNMEVVRLLVEEFGVDVNGRKVEPERGAYAVSGKRESPLHSLALDGHWWQVADAMPYLIARGADVDKRDQRGRTPLNRLLERLKEPWRSVNKRAIQVLLDHGADVTAANWQGTTCLELAMHNVEVFSQLLRYTTSIPPRCLTSAISECRLEIVEALLVAGADPNGRQTSEAEEFASNYGPACWGRRWTSSQLSLKTEAKFPLHLAMVEQQNDRLSCTKCVDMLLKFGADILAEYETSTILHQLLADQVKEPLQKLFEKGIKGVDPNRIDAHGSTLFHLACQYRVHGGAETATSRTKRPAVAESLLSLGADIYAKDKYGCNPLHYFSCMHYGLLDMDIFTFIIRSAPELINERNKEGKTSFHLAMEKLSDNTQVVDILLDAGADPSLPDKEGKTPVHILLEKGFGARESAKVEESPCRVIFHKLLAIPGVDINAVDEIGDTPVFKHLRSRSSYGTTTEECMESEAAILDLLDERGVDWTVRNNKGETLIHAVVQSGGSYRNSTDANSRFRKINYLMGKGVDLGAEDLDCKTALDMAADMRDMEMLALFGRQGQARATEMEEIPEFDDL
ncbi:hypothetical protein NLG97_g4729 [Lecanicillium saksenae]|uniref:Uncharacterized protein n=1 Tax=Lecanicillium saksenae TaxID=468837 RepID=A0ACC1QUH1_9HYPO|nr:hypothetical protein NLG97_g4729 [Lecanicillium saksenae]